MQIAGRVAEAAVDRVTVSRRLSDLHDRRERSYGLAQSQRLFGFA